MTREEAKLKYTGLSNSNYALYVRGKVFELLDEIYDDVESMTCDGCKYCVNANDKHGWCNNPTLFEFVVSLDFGCNRHERKSSD